MLLDEVDMPYTYTQIYVIHNFYCSDLRSVTRLSTLPTESVFGVRMLHVLTLPTESVFGVRMLHVLTDSAMAATVALLVIK